MISTLVPPGVSVAESYEPEWDLTASAEELALVARAGEKRRREFAAGRACARLALERLGRSSEPVLRGPNREPVWPAGVVGSITHTTGYCAAAVTEASRLLGLGIDAEANQALSRSVAERVCTAFELRSVQSWLAPGVPVPSLIFSAKEAVFKAWYPLARVWLGYQDAEIDLDLAARCFAVRLLPSARVAALGRAVAFTGRFAYSDQHVFTVVTATEI